MDKSKEVRVAKPRKVSLNAPIGIQAIYLPPKSAATKKAEAEETKENDSLWVKPKRSGSLPPLDLKSARYATFRKARRVEMGEPKEGRGKENEAPRGTFWRGPEQCKGAAIDKPKAEEIRKVQGVKEKVLQMATSKKACQPEGEKRWGGHPEGKDKPQEGYPPESSLTKVPYSEWVQNLPKPLKATKKVETGSSGIAR